MRAGAASSGTFSLAYDPADSARGRLGGPTLRTLVPGAAPPDTKAASKNARRRRAKGGKADGADADAQPVAESAPEAGRGGDAASPAAQDNGHVGNRHAAPPEADAAAGAPPRSLLLTKRLTRRARWGAAVRGCQRAGVWALAGRGVSCAAGVAELRVGDGDGGGGAEAAAEGAGDAAKRARNLQKKLRQIAALRERAGAGEALGAEQREKLAAEAGVRAELAALGAPA